MKISGARPGGSTERPRRITGLWQVMRTRSNGLDFQEWIKYDIQYIEYQSLGLDLRIIWGSILLILRGPFHREFIRVRGTQKESRPKSRSNLCPGDPILN